MDMFNGTWKHLWMDIKTDVPGDSSQHTLRRAVLPRATLSAVVLFAHWEASMTNRHVLQRGCNWLASLLSCLQAQSQGKKKKKRKKRDGEKVGVAERLTKFRRKRKEREKQSRGWRVGNKQRSRSRGLQHSRNNGLEINGLVIHSWSDAALAVATRESEHN